ncbi:LysR family transcriptional regulator [Celerinatantimonas diazotrophica]|uniref:LysR family glycine cleavage system transcriptional activator n=1 Tax=Celerinatantimonas diazotrophica TaxID=412034 RepID=A0A4R1J825_9GAMM|nr:LysR family transcriptional regulator [Celerinatantimonas diazotrophica]TCK46715.1 LysR family glycine cleavage system transcriptional activator [Celerinatantimonas diazotrophica]CAG9295417.1 Glycine cleavage system transcriptional activator [Celerinatantimonas diazotrophica]
MAITIMTETPKRRTPPFYAMYVFTVAAEHLNLTRAADELCLTQSAVSRQIAGLEEFLGIRLFSRHARGLTLTQDGSQLLGQYRQAFTQLREAHQLLEQAQQTQVRLKAPTCVLRWLLPVLMQIEQELPHYQVNLQTYHNHNLSPFQDNADAVIIYTNKAVQVPHLKLFEEYIIPVTHPNLGKLSSTAHWLDQNFTFLHPTEDGKDWQLWLTNTALSYRPKRNQYFQTMDLAINAALQGFGVTLADPNLITEELNTERLVQIDAQSVATGFSYYLIYSHWAEEKLRPLITAIKKRSCSTNVAG